MNEIKRLIFKVDHLRKNYGTLEAINVKKLEIHPGTIYALVGPPGCGKTTLLEILAGTQKQSSGELYFENFQYKTNWFGKVKRHDEIFYNYGFDDFGTGTPVRKVIVKMYGKKSNIIMKRHFSSPKFKHLWNRSVSSLTKGELHWVGMVLSLESDPRVLLVDDYGIHITNDMEQEFRSHLKRMNRTLGTTIIVSSPNEDLVKNFASVLIFMDNGHISKIRSKSNRLGKPRKHGRKNSYSNKRRTYNKGKSNNLPGKRDQQKNNKRSFENKSDEKNRGQKYNSGLKQKKKNKTDSNLKKLDQRKSINRQKGRNSWRNSTELSINENVEQLRKGDPAKEVQYRSANVHDDKKSDNYNNNESDGNRIDLQDNVQNS